MHQTRNNLLFKAWDLGKLIKKVVKTRGLGKGG